MGTKHTFYENIKCKSLFIQVKVVYSYQGENIISKSMFNPYVWADVAADYV